MSRKLFVLVAGYCADTLVVIPFISGMPTRVANNCVDLDLSRLPALKSTLILLSSTSTSQEDSVAITCC